MLILIQEKVALGDKFIIIGSLQTNPKCQTTILIMDFLMPLCVHKNAIINLQCKKTQETSIQEKKFGYTNVATKRYNKKIEENKISIQSEK